MHEYNTQTRDAILDYLNQEFPEYKITEEKNKDSYCFRLKAEAEAYFLRVMFTAISDAGSLTIKELLEQYAAANTMRG
ncbi:MAG: hypothetical protein AAGB35_08910, partial [Pseudomonadota bacterium]